MNYVYVIMKRYDGHENNPFAHSYTIAWAETEEEAKKYINTFPSYMIDNLWIDCLGKIENVNKKF